MDTGPKESCGKATGGNYGSEPPVPRKRQSDLLQNIRAQLKSGQTQAVYVPKREQADADMTKYHLSPALDAVAR